TSRRFGDTPNRRGLPTDSGLPTADDFGQVLPGQLDDLGERVRVVDGQVGQGLAVEFDQGPLEAGHELAVAQAARPAGGVDADDPQPPEQALAHPAVAEGVDARPDQRHPRLADEVVAALAEPLGELPQPLAAAHDRLAAAGAYHDSTPCNPKPTGCNRWALFTD